MIEKFVVIPEGCDCQDTDAFDSPDKYTFKSLETAKAFVEGRVSYDKDILKLEEDDRSAYNIYKITAVRLASVI